MPESLTANLVASFRPENLAFLCATCALMTLPLAAISRAKAIPLAAGAALLAALAATLRWASVDPLAGAGLVAGAALVVLECRVPLAGVFAFGGFVLILVSSLHFIALAGPPAQISLLLAFPAALFLTIEYTVIGVMVCNPPPRQPRGMREIQLLKGRR